MSQMTIQRNDLKRLARVVGGRRWRMTHFVCGLLVLVLPNLFNPPVCAQRRAVNVDPASVQRAIDRGVAYLRKSQTDRGGWNEYGGQSCGLSALCVLSLLNSGVSRDDPAISKAMKYLRSFEPNETYSVSLQTLVYCQLGAAADLPRIRRNVQWLVETQKREGSGQGRVGGWSYGRRIGSGDPSNSQFALLALGAAKDRGIEVEGDVFERALEYWKVLQRGDGGWAYGSSQPTTGSMTSAGIASILIARGGVSGTSSRIEGGLIRCCGSVNEGDDPVEQALTWMGDHFSVEVNPGGDSMTFYYYLYALERVGRLSGRRFIGGHDWYREGAEQLLEQHDPFQGFWSGAAPMENNRDIATSFALLFLSKGKRQVVAGQLQYKSDRADAWNSHPEGLKQLVRQVERDWGRDLTWQTIRAEAADGAIVSLESLLQTPVLLIRGREALRLPDTLVENLGAYIEQGGTIFFEADGGDGCGDASAFEASVNELCAKWFDDARLDRLPPTHPVWFAEREVPPAAITNIDKNFWVYGVQACCRTAVFYVPNSLSCRWELSHSIDGSKTVSDNVRSQIDLALRIGENVIAYATGRELKDKLEERLVIDGGDPPEPNRTTIEIAMLSLGAAGEEARRAIPNATELIREKLQIDLSAAKEPIGLDANSLGSVPILWLHGRTAFELSDSERKTLREYLDNQGMIFATSICGSEAFSESFRREMSIMLPESPLQRMEPSHPALTQSAYGGFDIQSITIRTPNDRGRGQVIQTRESAPLIEYAVVDNMAAVFFSSLDVSCALESPNSVQCPGYSTEDAAKIVANMLLYGLNQ